LTYRFPFMAVAALRLPTCIIGGGSGRAVAMSKALLFPRAILRAEFEADQPFREALAIKRERLAARRAARGK
jgi:hypothetical protein